MNSPKPRRAARDSAPDLPAYGEPASIAGSAAGPPAIAVDDAEPAAELPDPGGDAPLEVMATAGTTAAIAEPAAAETAIGAAEKALAAAPAAELPPSSPPASAPTACDSDGSGWTAWAGVPEALARAYGEIVGELSGVAQSGIAAGADAALAMLGARTYAEALEINAALGQRGVAALLAGSARLSEIGIKAMAEASRPLFEKR